MTWRPAPKTTAVCVLLLLSLLPFLSSGQSKLSCASLHNGTFYFYPKNSSVHYYSRREGDYQYESNMFSPDTVVWQVKWLNDCTYILKYVSGGKHVSPEALKIMREHKLAYEIESVTDSYYVFKGYLDKASTPPIQTDTMWLNEKTNVANNELFRRVINETVLRKAHFSDTSKYAVLYVYRPGKLTNSLASYPLYFDDNLLCTMQNKSGYIFVILKEGKFKINSTLFKDESALQLDVKFGNTYYVKSMIHWGMSSRLYNFKLDMALMDPKAGKPEFADVTLQ